MTRALPLASTLLAAACAEELSVHLRVGERPPNPGYLVKEGVAQAPAQGIQVQRFQLAIRNLRLQSYPTVAGETTPDQRVIGPGLYLVDLPAATLTSGTFTEVLSGYHVGPKSFYEMDINLQPVGQSDVDANPALAPLLGSTFVITGTANGTPFTFQSTIATELIRSEVYRMGTNHNNVDVNIAPGGWFVDSNGGALDPTSTDPTVHSAIEANVAASIDAYEDDNLDGIPDPLG